MGPIDPSETTLLLRAWADGDATALDRLTPRVYRELRRIAGHFMREERPDHTLQATAVVHEAYLRLIDVRNVQWEHRAHFFAVSARIMRRILLDAARKRATGKRSGPVEAVNLDLIPEVSPAGSRELIALDDALQRLAMVDARKEQVVELRFFGGLSVDETAVVLKISPRTVLSDWSLARAWLLVEITRE